MSVYAVGDRVRHWVDGCGTGTVVGHLDTPNLGRIALVAFDDEPPGAEACGDDELRPLDPPAA